MSYNSPNVTKQFDPVVIKYEEPVPYPIDKTGVNDIAAGDQVWFDATNHWVASVDTDAHAATYAGIAMEGSYLQPYNTKVYRDQIPVLVKGIVRQFSTSGDTMHEGDAVYQTTSAAGNPATVTSTAGGNSNKLGYCKMPPGISSIAGGATVLVQVQITALWPVTSV